jgi:hypothetical protein
MPGETRFDGDLQMYVDDRRDANHDHLLFLKWLVEQERIERPISDEPSDSGATWTVPGDRAVPNRLCVPRWFGR